MQSPVPAPGTTHMQSPEKLKHGTTVSMVGSFLRQWMGAITMFGIFLFVAFMHAWRSTHDLDFPNDIDLFRDAALAHNVMAGKFPSDPYYVGAQNWYNPLPAFLVAGIAKLLAADPLHVYARYGAVLGLIVPVAVFVFGSILFGRWAAVCAMFAFLFLRPEVSTWVNPTYSPWLFANGLALVPMTTCIILALRAHPSNRHLPFILCGAALGVTFLAHTGAAIIAGSVALVVVYTGDRLVTLRRWMIILIVAFVVSLPFTVSILFHYRLHILHRAAQEWFSEETSITYLPTLLRELFSVKNAVAVWGGVMLLRDRSKVGVRRVIFTWLGVASLLYAYSMLKQAMPQWSLMNLIPAFHWLFLLRLARTLLFGFGLYRLLLAVVTVAKPRVNVGLPVAVCVTLLTMLGWNYQKYTGLFDYRLERSEALVLAHLPGYPEAIEWLRTNTPVDAVILADPISSVMMVGTAYRHTVALYTYFSNPYVQFEERQRAAETMFSALAKADEIEFRASASEYGVGYVLLTDVTSAEDGRLAVPFAPVCFSKGAYAVLRINR